MTCWLLLWLCLLKILLAFASVSVASAQLTGFNLDFNFDSLDSDKSTTTPVPILRYIDTQNPDGSYTYGYENGDGTYKIETRYATGEVKGKYGYYDDQGVLREVEYGATPTGGFAPSGNGIQLPEVPTQPQVPRPQPQQPAQPAQPVQPAQPTRRFNVVRRKRPQESNRSAQQPDLRTQLPVNRRRNQGDIINRNLPIRPRPTQQPRLNFREPAPVQPAFRPQTTTQRPVFVPRAQPQQPVALPLTNSARFSGHPAQNIDLNTGSYTISY